MGSRLHLQASEWYESQARYELAIRHALAAQSWPRAAYLIDALADDLLAQDAAGQLGAWLGDLPEAALQTWPRLVLLQAGLALLAGDLRQAESSSSAVARQLQAPESLASWHLPASDPAHGGLEDVRGHLAWVRSEMALSNGQIELALEMARQALRLLPLNRPVWRGLAAGCAGEALYRSGALERACTCFTQAAAEADQAGSLTLHLQFGMRQLDCLRSLGRLQQSLQVCQQLLSSWLTRAGTGLSLASRLYACWAELLAETGRTEEALAAAVQARALAGENPVAREAASLTLARVYLAQRALQPARQVLAAILDPSQSMAGDIRELRIDVELSGGHTGAAAEIFASLGLDPAHDLKDESIGMRRLAARLLLAAGKTGAALARLESICQDEISRGCEQAGVETLILLALAHQALDDEQACLDAISQALFLAAPQGWVLPFLRYGMPLARLLYRAAAQDIQPEFIARLLDRMLPE